MEPEATYDSPWLLVDRCSAAVAHRLEDARGLGRTARVGGEGKEGAADGESRVFLAAVEESRRTPIDVRRGCSCCCFLFFSLCVL